MGRPRIDLTDQQRDEALRCAEHGLGNEAIASFIRIPEPSLQTSLRRDKEFKRDLACARGKAQAWGAAKLRQMIEAGDGQALRFFLARRWPKEWGRMREEREVHRVDVTTQGGALVVPGVVDMATWERIYGRGPDSVRGDQPSTEGDDAEDDGGQSDS